MGLPGPFCPRLEYYWAHRSGFGNGEGYHIQPDEVAIARKMMPDQEIIGRYSRGHGKGSAPSARRGGVRAQPRGSLDTALGVKVLATRAGGRVGCEGGKDNGVSG